MSGWSSVENATILSGITTEQVFQKDGAQWVIELNPGEIAVVQLKAKEGGSTDDTRFTIYETVAVSPGTLPTGSLTALDWSKYMEIVHDTSNTEDEIWITVRVSGVVKFGVTAQRHSGSTDTIDFAYMRVRKDGVNAQ